MDRFGLQNINTDNLKTILNQVSQGNGNNQDAGASALMRLRPPPINQSINQAQSYGRGQYPYNEVAAGGQYDDYNTEYGNRPQNFNNRGSSWYPDEDRNRYNQASNLQQGSGSGQRGQTSGSVPLAPVPPPPPLISSKKGDEQRGKNADNFNQGLRSGNFQDDADSYHSDRNQYRDTFSNNPYEDTRQKGRLDERDQFINPYPDHGGYREMDSFNEGFGSPDMTNDLMNLPGRNIERGQQNRNLDLRSRDRDQYRRSPDRDRNLDLKDRDKNLDLRDRDKNLDLRHRDRNLDLGDRDRNLDLKDRGRNRDRDRDQFNRNQDRDQGNRNLDLRDRDRNTDRDRDRSNRSQDRDQAGRNLDLRDRDRNTIKDRDRFNRSQDRDQAGRNLDLRDRDRNTIRDRDRFNRSPDGDQAGKNLDLRDRDRDRNTDRDRDRSNISQDRDQAGRSTIPDLGLKKEVSDQDCILEVFDTRLKSGILSFYSNQKKQFAYFHESVFVSTKVEAVGLQIKKGDKLKFHGTAEKAGHKISYCASIVWPLTSPVRIKFMKPQEDDLLNYESKVDEMLVHISNLSQDEYGEQQIREKSSSRHSEHGSEHQSGRGMESARNIDLRNRSPRDTEKCDERRSRHDRRDVEKKDDDLRSALTTLLSKLDDNSDQHKDVKQALAKALLADQERSSCEVEEERRITYKHSRSRSSSRDRTRNEDEDYRASRRSPKRSRRSPSRDENLKKSRRFSGKDEDPKRSQRSPEDSRRSKRSPEDSRRSKRSPEDSGRSGKSKRSLERDVDSSATPSKSSRKKSRSKSRSRNEERTSPSGEKSAAQLRKEKLEREQLKEIEETERRIKEKIEHLQEMKRLSEESRPSSSRRKFTDSNPTKNASEAQSGGDDIILVEDETPMFGRKLEDPTTSKIPTSAANNSEYGGEIGGAKSSSGAKSGGGNFLAPADDEYVGDTPMFGRSIPSIGQGQSGQNSGVTFGREPPKSFDTASNTNVSKDANKTKDKDTVQKDMDLEEEPEEDGGSWRPKKHRLSLDNEKSKSKDKIQINLSFNEKFGHIGKMPGLDRSKKIQRHPPKPPKSGPDIEVIGDSNSENMVKNSAAKPATSAKSNYQDKVSKWKDKLDEDDDIIPMPPPPPANLFIPDAPPAPTISQDRSTKQDKMKNIRQKQFEKLNEPDKKQDDRNKKQDNDRNKKQNTSTASTITTMSSFSTTKTITTTVQQQSSSFNYGGGKTDSALHPLLNFANAGLTPNQVSNPPPSTPFPTSLPPPAVTNIQPPMYPPQAFTPFPTASAPMLPPLLGAPMMPPGGGNMPPGVGNMLPGVGNMPLGGVGNMPPGVGNLPPFGMPPTNISPLEMMGNLPPQAESWNPGPVNNMPLPAFNPSVAVMGSVPPYISSPAQQNHPAVPLGQQHNPAQSQLPTPSGPSSSFAPGVGPSNSFVTGGVSKGVVSTTTPSRVIVSDQQKPAEREVDYIAILNKGRNIDEEHTVIAPIFSQRCSYNGTEYVIDAQFDPNQKEIESIIIGEANVGRMADIMPRSAQDKNLWRQKPLMFVHGNKTYLKNVEDILFDVMCRLKNDFRCDSTHIFLIVGYTEAPFLKAENIYSQYLDLVEMAILYNLENETNFSLSFGELHYPKNVRVFDKTICTINQVIRVINHYFLFSQSMGMWEVMLSSVKNKDDLELNVKGSEYYVQSDKYANGDPNILNDEVLFKFSKRLRMHLLKRSQTIDRISSGNTSPPPGIDFQGKRIDLPSPRLPPELSGRGLSDILVQRMMSRMRCGEPNIPRPFFNIENATVSSKKV